ncbi:MAG: hypothetical protein ACTSV7_08815 [Candidatus Baldrarchaeia archaeon]
MRVKEINAEERETLRAFKESQYYEVVLKLLEVMSDEKTLGLLSKGADTATAEEIHLAKAKVEGAEWMQHEFKRKLTNSLKMDGVTESNGGVTTGGKYVRRKRKRTSS